MFMMYYEEEPSSTGNRILSLMPSSSESRGNFRPPPNPIHSGFAIGRYASVNPWDLRRYQENTIQSDIEHHKLQVDINRAIYSSALIYTGHDPRDFDIEELIPDYVPEYNSYEDYMQKREEAIEADKVHVAINSPQVYSNEVAELQNHWLEETEKNLRRYEGMSKEDQYRELDKLTYEALEWQHQRQQRDFSNRYSKSAFRKYLNSSNSNTSWKTVTSMDDLEVQLPTGISSNYARLRAKFYQQLKNVGI